MTKGDKILNKLTTELNKHNIFVQPDYVKRHDGELCDNILFTKDDLEKRIYRPLLLREGGQCKVIKGDKVLDLTDAMWIETHVHNIKHFFDENI